MFQPLTASIGLRYLRAKRRNGFISFISLASVLGIFIGVVALITTISVMNGFQEELRNRILGTVAHATVEGVDGNLKDWPNAVKLAMQDKRVLGAAPYVQTESLLQGQNKQGAMLRGILPELEGNVSDLPEKMRQGSLSALQAGPVQHRVGFRAGRRVECPCRRFGQRVRYRVGRYAVRFDAACQAFQSHRNFRDRRPGIRLRPGLDTHRGCARSCCAWTMP